MGHGEDQSPDGSLTPLFSPEVYGDASWALRQYGDTPKCQDSQQLPTPGVALGPHHSLSLLDLHSPRLGFPLLQPWESHVTDLRSKVLRGRGAEEAPPVEGKAQ